MIQPPAKLSREIVETARLAVAGGATIREVADRLGVSYEGLRKRSLRGGWLTPQRVARATEQRATERATELHATSRAERGAHYEERLGTAAMTFAEKAAAMSPDELLASAGSLEKLDRIGRRTLRLDGEREDKNAINIALLGNYTEHLTPTLEAHDEDTT